MEAEGQTNTFPSSGNVGIDTTTPVAKLEVAGDIKSNSTNYDYYNVVNLAPYSTVTLYPVVFGGNGAGGPVKFEIVRNNVHEDGNWYGTLDFVGIFNSYGWGNTSAQFQYKYEVWPAVNMVSYVGQQYHGTSIIIYLKGGRHYYIKSNTPIQNLSSMGSAYTINPGVLNDQITVSPTSNISQYPPTTVPSGGTESIVWRHVSPGTSLAVSGNIGIGLSDPSQKLEVRGNGARIRVSCSTNASKYYFDIQANPTDTNTVNLYATNGADILKYASGANTVALQPISGNVIIGKTSQANNDYKLDVNGNIRANKLVVNSTGADYVFDPSYRITSIDSLDAYIKSYHHLPGIPAAKQMEENGLDLGDAYTDLLKKLEETTEYVIQEHKSELKLLDEVRRQQKKIDELEAKLNK
jgi:hypothetical protein